MAGNLNPTLLTIVPLAPLVGAIAAGLFGKTIGRRGAHWITCIGVAISLAISVQTLLAVLDGARFNATVYEWMTLGALKMEKLVTVIVRSSTSPTTVYARVSSSFDEATGV